MAIKKKSRKFTKKRSSRGTRFKRVMRGGGDEISYGMLYKEGHINKNWNHREIKLKSNDNSKYEILWYEKGGTKPKGSIDVTNLVTLNKSNKGENISLEIKNNNINPRNYTTLKLESRSQDENNKLLELYYNLQLRKKQQELETKLEAESLQQDDIYAFSSLIDEAEAANIKESVINPYKRKLTSFETSLKDITVAAVKTELQPTINAIEKAFETEKKTKFVNAAFRGLLYVYERHPPIRPTYTLDQIKRASSGELSQEELSQEEQSQEEQSQEEKENRRRKQLKKMLLFAQKDYHPDRNQGKNRVDLVLTATEWEIISETITQQLSIIYDELFKGARKLERHGGSRKRRRTIRRRKSRKYKQ